MLHSYLLRRLNEVLFVLASISNWRVSVCFLFFCISNELTSNSTSDLVRYCICRHDGILKYDLVHDEYTKISEYQSDSNAIVAYDAKNKLLLTKRHKIKI